MPFAIGVATAPPVGASPPAVPPAPPARPAPSAVAALASVDLPAPPAFESDDVPAVAPAPLVSDDLPPADPAPPFESEDFPPAAPAPSRESAPGLDSDDLPPADPAPPFESDDLPPAAPAPSFESAPGLDSEDLPPVATGFIDFEPPDALPSGASLPAFELDLPLAPLLRAIGESVPFEAEAPLGAAPVAVDVLPSGMRFEPPLLTLPVERAGLVRPELPAEDGESPFADDPALPVPARPPAIGERPLDLPDAPPGDASLGPEEP
jgi:hypothetical protein